MEKTIEDVMWRLAYWQIAYWRNKINRKNETKRGMNIEGICQTWYNKKGVVTIPSQ